MKLDAGQLTVFFLSISIMLLFAKVLGELFTKFRQPAIVGEIVAGIILGPTVLGSLLPAVYMFIFPPASFVSLAIDGITSLAVVMLLLVLGIEVDFSILIKNSRPALFTSVMGVILPFIMGFALSYISPVYFGNNEPDMKMVFALFMGTAMSISALPVIARTLLDLGLIRTRLGLIIIASAMFGDLAGWIFFSVILGMIGTDHSVLGFSEKIIFIFIFFILMLSVGRSALNFAVRKVQEKFSYPGGILNLIFILGFACAALTEYVGIHAIFGAFIVGIALGDSIHLKQHTRELVQQFVTNLFAPLFFVSIGLRINFYSNFDLMLVLVVLAIAFLGKILGSSLGAYWGGMSKEESLAIGFGMNSRGAMEIILGMLALQAHLIKEKVFVALVIMAVITSLTSAPLMTLALRRKKNLNFRNLLSIKNTILMDAFDKNSAIVHLSELMAGQNKLNAGHILDAVMKREELVPTGLENAVALPHARINIDRPFVAVGLNRRGLEFNSPDHSKSRLIILLVTPAGENEMQLQLLAEIATLLSDQSRINEALESETPEELLENLRK
jgi:Kef-type K+ transport system membrane component KefB/mannitol/fructose-specific phosphotransferase system IIA component (Ntr-type)